MAVARLDSHSGSPRVHSSAVVPSDSRIVLLILLLAVSLGRSEGLSRRAPVHPRRNVDEFPPVETRHIRFTILATSHGEPCLDELEVYGPDAPGRNLALSSGGTIARASGSFAGFGIHALAHVNDGVLGNGHSWISDTRGTGWVELELPAAARIDRVVWSRDREGKFTDRLPLHYRIEAARPDGTWILLASDEDREPLDLVVGENPVYAGNLRRIAPAVTEMTGSGRPAAREYLLETWQTARGLPSNTVTTLLAARDGWLWVGTTNGVAVFDGISFLELGESQGLPALGVTCLMQDSHGTIWAGTQGGGAARWDGSRFEPIAVNDSTSGENTVLCLAEDANGVIWAGTPDGLRELQGHAFQPRTRNPVPRMAVAGGTLWFIDGTIISRWTSDGPDALSPLDSPPGSASPPLPESVDRSRFSSISSLAAGADGALWFGGANGYFARILDGNVSTFGEKNALLASTAWELLVTRRGDVWVGTAGSGMGRLRDDRLLHLTTDDGLAANSVLALCEDHEGNVWAGTSGGGLIRISPRRVQTVTTRDGLSHNAVMALAQDASGTVWIGTNGGGLNRFRDETGAAPGAPGFILENQSVASLLPDADGSLWVGADAGLFRVDGQKAEYLGHYPGMPPGPVTALHAAPGGSLWLGTLQGGALLFDGRQASVPPGLEPLAGQPVTSILTDLDGAVWIGTAGQGVARHAGASLGRWTRADGLASNFIRTLRMDAAGAVWAGTSGGLTRWKNGRLFTWTVSHGLPEGFISQILDDTDGHLWLGTNRGIVRVAHRSLDAVAEGRAAMLEVLTLGLGDGLPSLECTGGYHPAGLRLQDGRLCFGTVAGLALVDPRRFSEPGAAPPVFIREIDTGRSAGLRPATLTLPPSDTLTLTHADARTGSLDVHFTALHYTAPDRVRFRYRMTGLESTWNEAGSTRSARYTRLPPGEFVFAVVASADGLTWSAPATVRLVVPAAWWQSPWTAAAGAITALTLVAAVVRLVTRRRLQRRLRAVEQQFALERERTRIARDIHDDLGSNLTRISLLSALGRQKRDHPDAVDHHFQSIAATATELVQSLDAIVWAVNPRHDTLESLARYLTRFAGDFCSHAGVRLRLDVPPRLADAVLGSELRHNVFLAAKEALNNALRHADATELRLAIAATASHLTITIADDGRGFIPGSHPEGDGLANMRQRLADSGGTCGISTAAGSGTTIHLTIPLPSAP